IAISRPAITQSALTRKTPRAFCAASTVASVVTSPVPTSSSSARRMMSRYSDNPGIFCVLSGLRGERLGGSALRGGFITLDSDLSRVTDCNIEAVNPQRRAQIRLHNRHPLDVRAIGTDAHRGDRHFQRLLGFRPLFADLEEHVGRPLVRCLIVIA